MIPVSSYAGFLCLMALFLGQTPFVPSSDPENIVRAGDKVYFTADDGIHGREVWCFDDTRGEAVMVGNLAGGDKGGDYILQDDMVAGKYFLFAAVLEGRIELYSTDGTPESARYLWEYSSVMRDTFRFWHSDGAHVYISNIAPVGGSEIWRSNGTAEGTVKVLGPELSAMLDPLRPISSGGMYAAEPFAANLHYSENGVENFSVLWRGLASLGVLGTLGETALLRVQDGRGAELWAAAQDTAPWLVMDIAPGPKNGLKSNEAFQLGSRCFFAGDDLVHGVELWVSDGSSEGTHLLYDINPGLNSADPYDFRVVGDLCYFSATTALHGKELWVTDGTSEGTRMVIDLLPEVGSGEPYAKCIFGKRLLFSSHHEEFGEELWITEKDGSGATLVKDISPGNASSYPYNTRTVGGYAYFAAETPEFGRELWRTDGTPEGTRLAADIAVTAKTNPGSYPAHLTPLGDKLFFVANDLEHGAELWSSTAGGAGAYLVRDIFPGTASSDPKHLTPHHGILYFSADNGHHGEELWVSDGTESGTSLKMDLNSGATGSNPREFEQGASGYLYFVAFGGKNLGNAIHRVDAEHNINIMLNTDKRPPVWDPKNLREVGEWVYFTADDGQHGEELWRCNGQTAEMVRDILTTPKLGSAPEQLSLMESGGLYFTADDSIRGREIWRLDAAQKIPRLHVDLNR